MNKRILLALLLSILAVLIAGLLVLEVLVLKDLRQQEEILRTRTEEAYEEPPSGKEVRPSGTAAPEDPAAELPETDEPETPAAEPSESGTPEPSVIGTPYPETAPEGWSYSEPDDETYEPFRDGIRVWVGDSRMVGLERSATWEPGKDLFIAKGAMSYQWFLGSAVPALKQVLSSNQVSYVLINMGLNDCANNCKGWKDYTVQNYIETINALIDAYPDTEFCFLSVGLTDGVYHGTYPINPAELMVYIDSFNFNMYTYCRTRFIPVSRFIEDNGFRTADGVHYGTEVNRAIYNYVLGILRGEQLGGSG